MHALARRIWLLSLCSLLPLLAAPLAAQGKKDDKIDVTARFEPAEAPAGATVTLVVEANVVAGFHAYGSLEKTNVPVSLVDDEWEHEGLQREGAAQIPPGQRKSAFGVDSFPLPNRFEVKQRFVVPAGAPAGAITVNGALRYQLCDENKCLAPRVAGIEAVLNVSAAANASPPPQVKPGLRLVPDEWLPNGRSQRDGNVSVRTSLLPSPARAGEEVTLRLDVTVAKPYHAYGTSETTNLPVAVKPDSLQLGGLELAGPAVVPPGERATVFGVDAYPLPQTFRVTVPLRVPEAMAPGSIELGGQLDYQLCDENQCLDPERVAFGATLVVEAGAARDAKALAALAGADEITPRGDALGSWWALLLACVGGGLFALLMPCTYPMIPITFSFFTKQADARGGKVLSLALVYGAGIVGMFALIGALAGVVGEHIVDFAAYWGTNLVIGVVFVVFGLSLLGVITLQPPRFLIDAAGKSRSAGGLTGVLLMGATLVVTSFTCTAPIVGLLLLPAVQSGDSLRPTVGMAVFGLTMALPFVLLALLPGRVRALPRSGEWMNTLKVSLGFVELAAALKFLSNAEYQLQLYWLPIEVFFSIWTLIFVVLAVYLWGLVPRAAIGNGRRAGGLVSLAFAAYCVWGALGNQLDFAMTALAPAYSFEEIPDADGHSASPTKHPLFVDDYDAALAAARQDGKLILVNLTGFTCVNCRMVERGILPDPAIAPLLEQHFVEARLHMDNEAAIPAEKWRRHVQLRQELIEGRITTPTYLTVDPQTGKLLVEHVLSGGPGAWLAGYREFLERSLRAAGRSVPADK